MQCIEKLHSFLPCDAMHSADCRKMFVSPSVCPSVCLTDTRRYSVKTTKHIIKVFSPSCSHTILVLPYQTVWQYYDWNCPNRSTECREYEKSRFSENISLNLGNDTR